MTATGPLATLFHFSYLMSAVLFIVGLKFLSHPARARQGNLVAALGMTVAGLTTLATLWVPGSGYHHQGLILAAIAIGAVLGSVGARRVAMTDMPQMVALLNGFGGGSAALISTAEFLHAAATGVRPGVTIASTIFGCIIGAIKGAKTATMTMRTKTKSPTTAPLLTEK